MATPNLCLHRGARIVARTELDAVDAPPPTETWFQLRHGHVLDTILETLQGSGFEVFSSQLSLTQDNARFFGTLDLSTEVAGGTTLAVGVRNSMDKTFPLGFCAGCRVFVCDNLAFRSDLLVARKHTRNGDLRFQEAIALAVRSLGQFRDAEARRIEQMRSCQLSILPQDLVIQGLVRYQTLQPRILFLQFLQLTSHLRIHASVLRSPPIVRLLADPQLLTDLWNLLPFPQQDVRLP